MKTIKTIVNIILGIGCFAVLNENIDALWVNLIGFGCIAMLCVINAPESAINK